ncbi:hypothetical protein E2K80_09730 [Rhodophyticola sp. CCM32]|uniref:TadE/TadG family type IV pilus assembly protein n=1 Tax=Rhodophyticola sp. CCM32 TaxID=2916397 RepID=UPI00107F5A2C|nr:TadE/TadG family type IV pilus assembly protein [Rhodophyticola sp. CCM32]QBY00973.1 hypothetical protein E2K80_09730 [Rhodophyticola sp. CCM32]
MIVRTPTLLQRLRSCAGLRRFACDEDGTITIFGLMMFVLMVGVGGIAVDVMRYETQRIQLQYTLDRAILAAAAINQQGDPEEVVRDYFAVSGLENYRLTVEPETGFNYRRVSARAEMDINSMFMHMFGIRALTSPAFGVAEERVQNVEISMVLDISGSMGRNSKLANMQSAASEFVTSVMEPNNYDTDEMLVSMSIIPYNGRVNAGSTIESVFTLSDEHDASNCTRFDPADYETTAIDPVEPVERLAHFDYDNRNQYYSNVTRYQQYYYRPHCQTSDYGAILPWSSNISALHAHINSLNANGWTAIDLGMKWGVGLLDPVAAPALQALEDAGSVHEDFADRPRAFDDDETMKIVILMTDGENTNQYDVVQQYKRGPSTVYYHEEDERWSMYIPDEDIFWIPNNNYNDRNGTFSDEPYRGNESVAIPWPYIWANYSARTFAGHFYYQAARRLGDYDYYYDLRYDSTELYAGANSADANLRDICDAAREQNIIVFTIAFEAPRRGENVMRYCATSDAHYYDVEGIEISEAFASIANTIEQLKLVQ